MTKSKLTALFLAVFAITTHAQTAANLPYTCDFEDAAERGNWTLENGVQTNQWAFGTATASGGAYSLYISNNNGTSNAYTINSTSYVYAYRSINFTAAGNHTISFNWKGAGEVNSDNLRAFLVPNATALTAGDANGNTSDTNNIPSGWIAVSGVLNGQGSTWQSFSASVNVTSTGTYKLVFFWKNNNSYGTNPPAAVDNISVLPYSISASSLTSFGYLASPYTPAAQTVTITNNGPVAVTLTQPTSTNFDIGTLSASSLAVGAKATFTVQPKADLAAGTYSETITISCNDGALATVSANFIATTTYYITGSGTSFSASKASAGGTPINANANSKAIQTVIDAIRTDAAGVPVTIQFGNGTDVLDIGTAGITFNGSATPAWGFITLAGKITYDGTASTISLNNGASITSTADIANTNSGSAISISSGTVTITGGTVQTTTGDAINTAGTVNISGGTVRATTGYAIYISQYGAGAVNITGGLVFAYGTAVSDVINRTYNTPSLTPAIIAWNSTGTTYTAGTSTNIKKDPEAMTAVWLNKNGSAGIDYENGTNTGFIAISGVTVNKADTPALPTGLAAAIGQTLADVALPAGWEWATPTASVGAAGTRTHKANYPSDADNYNGATDVDVSIIVEVRTRIDNFAELDPLAKTREAWGAYTDVTDGGLSALGNENNGTADSPEYAVVMFDGEYNVAKISYTLSKGNNRYDPYIGLSLQAVNNGTNYDLSKCVDGFRYAYKGVGHSFMAESKLVTDYNYHSKYYESSAAWKTVSVSLSELNQASGWGVQKTLNFGDIRSFAWQIKSPAIGELAIKDFYCLGTTDIELDTNPGTDPGTDPIRLPQVAIGNLRVQSIGNAILLENLPTNAKVEVYNLQGKRVYSTTSHSPLATSLKIEVQTGIYVLKIGAQTTKIAVK